MGILKKSAVQQPSVDAAPVVDTVPDAVVTQVDDGTQAAIELLTFFRNDVLSGRQDYVERINAVLEKLS